VNQLIATPKSADRATMTAAVVAAR
jgi:hypothetical protein